MPPKTIKKPAPTVLAKIKAHLEAQRVAEEEERKREKELLLKQEEEERIAKEQALFEKQQKNNTKDDHKKKEIEKREKQMEALLIMKQSGMQIVMTPELEEYEKKHMLQKIKLATYNQEEKQKIVTPSEIKVSLGPSLRSPICCVMGHVDAGKTSFLDKLRKSNVHAGEAGGITQQIGATFFSKEYLLTMMNGFDKVLNFDIAIPSMILMDTPGHESFANLRNRGSSICDIAIIIVDITHGLENQTRESLSLLKQKKCPFIVAVNKVDRLYDWQIHENMDIQQTMKTQKIHTLNEFETRINNIKLQLSEEGFNSELYYNNTDYKKVVSLVPISSKTGEGIVDLIGLQIKLVQQFMEQQISYKNDVQCTVLDVKPILGFGTTIDVILVNGILHVGDKIVLSGINAPIITRIKSLLTNGVAKETRVKNEYETNEYIKAAHCVKIVAENLDEVIAGTQLYVANTDEQIAEYSKHALNDVNNITSRISSDKIGVTVQSSTLGSLEALLSFLEKSGIPVGSVNLGTIHKKHVLSTIRMNEKNKKYACILAFDVDISEEARQAAQKENITIFSANVIYHLFDQFTKYSNEYEQIIKNRNRDIAVFPVVLQVLSCFRAKDPLVIGCKVLNGQLHVGTPLITRGPNQRSIGKVVEMQVNGKSINIAKTGDEIAVKIDGKSIIRETVSERNEHGNSTTKIIETTQFITFGRHVDTTSVLTSGISRTSINALKESFRDEMQMSDWELIIELKKEQNIK
jgi:translation initiation factor 5B